MTVLELLKKSDDKKHDLDIMRAISGLGNRQVILALIRRDQPMSVKEIAHAVDFSPNIVSHRLRALRKVNAVKRARKGKEIHYIVA